MVDYANLYANLRLEIERKLLFNIESFSELLTMDEWKRVEPLLYQFHKKLRKHLKVLYYKKIFEYTNIVNVTKINIMGFIIEYFIKNIKKGKSEEEGSFYSIANCWNDILRGSFTAHYYDQQFKRAEALTNITQKTYEEFYDFVVKENKKIIEEARSKQEKIIKFIKEVVLKEFDKRLKLGFFEKWNKRNFDLFLIVLVITGTLASGILGGFAVHWLTTSKHPEIYVANYWKDNGIYIEIKNKGEMAKNFAVLYREIHSKAWKSVKFFDFFDGDEETKLFIPLEQIEKDLDITAEDIVESWQEKIPFKIVEWDTISDTLNLELEVWCDNCKDNIEYIKSWESSIKTSETLVCREDGCKIQQNTFP